MTTLTERERELVAIGAAMASNCIPCMEHHIPAAKKAGLSDAEIVEAVNLADKVRQVPARKVLEVATAILGGTGAGQDAGQPASCAETMRSACCG